MRNLLLTISFLISFCSVGQVSKFKSSAYLFTTIKNPQYNSIECNFIIVVDLDNDRIKIYSDPIRTYNIIKNEKSEITGYTQRFEFLCLDEKGNECTIASEFSGSKHILQIIYPESILTYRCDPMID